MTLKTFSNIPPFKRMASSTTTPGHRTEPRVSISPADMIRIEQHDPDAIGNASRMAAGARSGETGFTCARCLQWFTQGTHHACKPYAEVIRNEETQTPTKGPMSAEEIRLLQEAGQL